MAKLPFAKAGGDEEVGSAQRAAAQLHGSAYVHAIRYGDRNSKEFKRAYSQHIGRFLSCVRAAGRVQKSASDEARDNVGRWTTGGSAVRDKVRSILNSTKRGAVKIRDVVDAATDHPEGGRRVASYAGALAGRAVAAMGSPDDVANLAQFHVANTASHVVNRVLNHPVAQKIATRAAGVLRKSLDPREDRVVKELVANAVAECDLPPQIAGSDTALRDVAVGAYRHCVTHLLAT